MEGCTNRDNLKKFLEYRGIETRVFFKPISTQPMYREKISEDSFALQISKDGLYLPTYTGLTEKDIDFITSEIKDFYSDYEE